jgi:hypothetical protein
LATRTETQALLWRMSVRKADDFMFHRWRHRDAPDDARAA